MGGGFDEPGGDADDAERAGKRTGGGMGYELVVVQGREGRVYGGGQTVISGGRGMVRADNL